MCRRDSIHEVSELKGCGQKLKVNEWTDALLAGVRDGRH